MKSKALSKSSKNPLSVRLNKFISQRAGLSRRKADEAIKKGEVFVNSQKVAQGAFFVDPKKDRVRIKKYQLSSKKPESVCFLFNKPQKVLSSRYDPLGRPLVLDYFKKHKKGLFPIGRLDWDSEGLLLLTNDGSLSAKILHPRNQIPKTYLVKLKGCPQPSHLKRLLRGVSLPGGTGKRKALFIQKVGQKAVSNVWVKIIISEGKKRQIREMFEKIGFPVRRLRRTAIGRLKMNKLTLGTFKRLRESDIEKVFQWPKEVKKPTFSPKKTY